MKCNDQNLFGSTTESLGVSFFVYALIVDVNVRYV